MEPLTVTRGFLLLLGVGATAFAVALAVVSAELDHLKRLVSSRPPQRPRGLPRACPLLRVVRASGEVVTVTIRRVPEAPKSEVA